MSAVRPPHAGGNHWKFLPTFLVRRPGFPFELLERLAFAETSAAAETVLAIEEALRQQRQSVWHQLHAAVGRSDSAALRSRLLELRRRIFQSNPPRPRDIELARETGDEAVVRALEVLAAEHERLSACQESGAAIFAAELERKRQVLRAIVDEPRFREAIFLSNPAFSATALQHYVRNCEAGRRPSKIRAIESKLVLYLQRFCAKNETTSFFGPTTYGRIEAGAEASLVFTANAPLVAQRTVFFAHWAIRELAALIAAEPDVQPLLRPLRSPLATPGPSGAQLALVEVSLKLAPIEAALLAAADGRSTIADLAVEHALGVDDCVGHLARLRERQLLLPLLDIPADVAQPLAWLQGWIDEHLPSEHAAGQRWRERLRRLDAAATRFRDTEFPARIACWHELQRCYAELRGADADGSARRGEGAHYADREIVFEDCLGGISDFSLGGRLAEVLRDELLPLLEADAARGELRRDALQVLSRRLVATLPAARRGRLPLSAVVRAYALNRRAAAPLHPDLAALAELDERLLRALQPGGESLPLPTAGEALLGAEPLFGSPDVSVAAADLEAVERGDFLLVIGEVQSSIGAWGYGKTMHPQPQRLAGEVEALVAAAPRAEELAGFTVSHDSKIKGFENPGKSIAFRARSLKPPELVVPYVDVDVQVDAGALRLLDRRNDQPMLLYCGVSDSEEEITFGAPRLWHTALSAGGVHTPRLQRGRVVYQRATWRFASEQLRDVQDPQLSGFTLHCAFARWRRLHRLPRHAFVRLPGETKPLYLDFDDYLLIEVLHAALQRTSSATVSEMLPGPEQLWFNDALGRYTTELRLTVANSR